MEDIRHHLRSTIDSIKGGIDRSKASSAGINYEWFHGQLSSLSVLVSGMDGVVEFRLELKVLMDELSELSRS